MKILLVTLTLILGVLSCRHSAKDRDKDKEKAITSNDTTFSIPAGYHVQKVDLGTLGTLSIAIPNNFDTAFYGAYYGDHSCSDRSVYSIYDSKYDILPDTISGFATGFDSLQFIEISHLIDTNCITKIKHANAEYLSYLIQKGKITSTTKASLKKINNIDFIIENNLENGIGWINALTIINNREIRVSFTTTFSTPNFYENMMKSLETIKITAANNS